MSLVHCRRNSTKHLADPDVMLRRTPASHGKGTLKSNRLSLHGVAMETGGKGLLITGASGIGKTTATIGAMAPGYFWIADDLALIGKDSEGTLIMTGHRKIRKYLHTEKTGIIEVSRVLPATQIKKKTRLDAVIDVVRTDTDAVSCELLAREILETKLPCLRICIPRDGYFSQNLLKNAISRFHEVG